MFTCFSVHACMCSTLTSAILYRVLEAVHDEDLVPWTSKPLNRMLMRVPMSSFVVGGIFFLVSAILKSWVHFEDVDKKSKGASIAFMMISGSVAFLSVVYTAVMVGTGPSAID